MILYPIPACIFYNPCIDGPSFFEQYLSMTLSWVAVKELKFSYDNGYLYST